MNHPTLPSSAKRMLLPLALLALATGAHAAPGDALDRCIDLASDHQVVRSGGGEHFLLKSGDDHYKVAFQRNCSSLPMASRITISTEGRQGRLCPGTGTVETPRDVCPVGDVIRIPPEDFQRQQRRRR